MPVHLRRDGNAFISATMRDILLQHVDGARVPFVAPRSIADPIEAERAGQVVKSVSCLIRRGLLRFNTTQCKPTHTLITEAGSVVLRKVMAEYIEVLVRAGYKVDKIMHEASLGRAFVNETRESAESKIPALAE